MMEKDKECLLSMLDSKGFTIFITFTITLIVIRVLYVIHRSGKPMRPKTPKPVSTLIVLGSGKQTEIVSEWMTLIRGHTAEMLNLLSVLQRGRFAPRYYIAAATDNLSLQKARMFENSTNDETGVATAEFMQIYRSREVGQSYISSALTTSIAIAHALWLMIKIRPQVILCNGPGTCFPLCLIAFLFKIVGIKWPFIFYVESIARVKKLSLCGLLLYKLRIADQFYVQWPQLQQKYHRALYVGCLM